MTFFFIKNAITINDSGNHCICPAEQFHEAKHYSRMINGVLPDGLCLAFFEKKKLIQKDHGTA